MSYLDIKDTAEKATLVKEYVTAMKTVKQRNMVNRELKLAIGDELQTLFHPIVNATKQAAEETKKELAPMKKTLTDIDVALTAQRVDVRPLSSKTSDTTFGIYRKPDGKLGMGNRVVQISDDKSPLLVPGLIEMIVKKHPQADKWNSSDLRIYKELVMQTKVKSFPNREATVRPHARWKWKMLRKMTAPGNSIEEEESEVADDTDSV